MKREIQIKEEAIETLDDLNNVDARYGNKKLGAMLKSVYPALDKETKKYDECYHAAPEGIIDKVLK